jgi:hypothetical protein
MSSLGSPEQTQTTTHEGRFTRDTAPAATTTGAPSSGRATASLVLGILSIPGALIPILGLALGVIGLVMGITARNDMRRAGGASGKAMAGIVLSCIGILFALVNWAAAVAMMT